MPASIYSTIEEQGFDDGILFMMTPDSSVIEAHLYGGIIISFKSLRLSFEQICSVFSSGDLTQINFQKSEIKPETIARGQIIEKTFPGAVAASAINPAKTTPSKLIRIVRLISSLIKSDKAASHKACEIMSLHISTLYPGFLPDIAAFKSRIGRLGAALGIATTFLEGKPFPSDTCSVPEWVFTHFDPIMNGLMKDVVLYFIFFGEVFKQAIRTTVEKETSLGAKQGFAILSKTVYPAMQNSGSAILFKGAEKIGEIRIDWHTDKKDAVLFTKADLDKLGLESGSKINLILMK
jgi:hypothetical protein